MPPILQKTILHLRTVALPAVACLALAACGDSLFSSTNHAPRADAGEDRQVEVGALVELDGEASDDPDGDRLTFAWALVNGPVWVGIDSASTSLARITLPVAGTFHFRLTVVDDLGASDRVDVQIIATVTPRSDSNQRPTADAGADAATVVGQAILLDGSGSRDAEGDSLSFLWVQLEGPGVVIGGGDQARARLQFAEPGRYVFRLLVVDAGGSSNSDLVTVDVTGNPLPPPNGAPVADAGPATHVFAGDTVTLDGSGSRDPDGDDLTWSWVQVSGPETVAIDGSRLPSATVMPAVAGDYVFRLLVSDGRDQAAADVRITVSPRVGSIEVEGVFDTGAP